MKPLKQGLTVVEILVVIVVIGSLLSILLPAVQRVRASSRMLHCSNNEKQLAVSAHSFEATFKTLPPWAIANQKLFASSHFLLLPYMEQENVYHEARGRSFEVRTIGIPMFACPDDFTLEGGRFANAAIALIPSRASRDGVNFGGTTYAINAQLATAVFKNGHPVKGGSTVAGIRDGASNCMLFGERLAFACGELYPTRGSPNLGGASFTWSIWSRGGKNDANNWDDGAPSAPIFPAPNARPKGLEAEGYSWWDCPAFDAPYRNVGAKELGPGPRSYSDFRDGWMGVANPGGIQSGAAMSSVDYRRLQAVHSAIMNAAFADGSVRRLAASIDSTTFREICNPSDGGSLSGL